MIGQKIGFIGAGQMARALAQGFVAAGLVKAEDIIASDPYAAAVGDFRRLVAGARTSSSNRDVVEGATIIFLAVKPQQMHAVLEEIKSLVSDRHLLVSIAAGVRLQALVDGLGPATRLVRVMPNTPCLVAESASGYCLGTNTTAQDEKLVEQLLSSVGKAFVVDEKLLDAVTGLSGSGPAFVYVMIEALSDGGVRMGLPRDIATKLAAQTVKGAAEMVLATGDHPAVLKDRVASPGGTTIAGLHALEAGGIRASLIGAVEAATKRSAELARGQ